MIHGNVSIKSIVYQIDYSCNPITRICENSKYLKRIVDDSIVLCN